MDLPQVIFVLATMTVLVVAFLCIYFLPAIVANNRNHHNKEAILMLNFMVGWTLVGWVIAMTWAYTDPQNEFQSKRIS